MENINELSFNLPDYIQGKLEDDNLIARIEDEIRINDAFRAEYEDMRSTFAFLRSAELSAPPDAYFNNLLPHINSRISERGTAEEKSIFEKILSYWKVLIPVLPLVLIFIVYKTYFINPGSNVPVKEEKVQELQQPPVIKEEKPPVTATNETPETTKQDLSSTRRNDNRENGSLAYNYRTDYTTPGIEEQATEGSTTEAVLEAITEDSPYIEESEDPVSEFEELDEDEQADLLTTLQNTEF